MILYRVALHSVDALSHAPDQVIWVKARNRADLYQKMALISGCWAAVVAR